MNSVRESDTVRVGIRRGFPLYAACVLMTLSAAVRIFAYFSFGGRLGLYTAVFMLAFPAVSCLFFTFNVMTGKSRSEKAFVRLNCLSVLIGVIFFILKAFTFAWWHQALCTVLYLLVLGIFTLTSFGKIRTKVPQILVFSLPLTFHVTDDLIRFLPLQNPDPLEWLLEGSVVLIMTGLLLYTLALVIDKAG